jgi:hypothetical protein
LKNVQDQSIEGIELVIIEVHSLMHSPEVSSLSELRELGVSGASCKSSEEGNQSLGESSSEIAVPFGHEVS